MPPPYGRSVAIAVFVFTIACALQSAGAQGTATPAAGLCQQQYQQCQSNPNSNRAQCESMWRSCVSNKCQANDSASVEQCPKDPDCESSCTEDASSEKGVLSCCLGGPQHNNSCPNKIDGTCLTGQASLPAYPPQYNEWDKIPPLNMPILNNDDNFDFAAVISPDYPLNYPEGTAFDENGMPSNAPLQNPSYSMTNIPPLYNPPSPLSQLPDYPTELHLPPEYQPVEPYLPAIGSSPLPAPSSNAGANYTVPPASQQAPFFPSQGTFSVNNSASQQSVATPCTLSLFGFCLWR
jgi:hypothetical protein